MSSGETGAVDVIRTGWDRRTALWFTGTYVFLGAMNIPAAIDGSVWRIAFLVLTGILVFGFVPFMVWRGQEAFVLNSTGISLVKRQFIAWDAITALEVRPLKLNFNALAPQRVLVVRHLGEPAEQTKIGWFRRRSFRMTRRVYGTTFVLPEAQLKESLEDIANRLRRFRPALEVTYVGTVSRSRPNPFSFRLIGYSLAFTVIVLVAFFAVSAL